jgi:hypothetical protein
MAWKLALASDKGGNGGNEDRQTVRLAGTFISINLE